MSDKKEKKEETPGGEQDDVSFLRTGDIVTLTCLVSNTKDGGAESERVCLSTEGFGNRMCTLENVSNLDCPPDISMCMLYIDNALSVRALQEMMGADGELKSTSGSGGHKTLLYGHAVQLRHVQSEMYLSCLASCSSNDKLAFDVGVKESNEGEACWWTIHPASKQRSEGEKVRVGDDVILVSVATERYLHMAYTNSYIVIASFHQTLWNVVPVSSGGIRTRNMGFLFGNDVLRLFHGNDECLTIPENWSESLSHNMVIYEGGPAVTQARSLWRIELVRTKWHGALVGFEQRFRIRHITTGRYLGVTGDGPGEKLVQLFHKDRATYDATTFVLYPNKDPKKQKLEEKEEEGMGNATIHYGETNAFIRHLSREVWLTYQTNEVTKKGLGKVEEKKATAHSEGHMDDCYTFFMALEEESKSARVIRKCSSVLNRFLKGIEGLQTSGNQSAEWCKVDLVEVLNLMKDLISYFAQPEEDQDFEERQTRFRALRSRQDLFQAEGVLNMILDTIDKFSMMESLPNFAGLIGDDNQLMWEEISTYLYLLVAAMIKGNHSNCAQFAAVQRLDWLFSRLSNPQSAEGILDVLYCVLTESPEALNMINEGHIKSVISLLEKVGRDPKVLDVLSSLCEGNGMAVRSSQNTIAQHLLPGRDLLLQTSMRDQVSSMMPNILVGLVDGSSLFKRWYFEAEVEHIETVTKQKPYLRIGWANTVGYRPFPGSGDGWGYGGVGDDFYSYAYDGLFMYCAGRGRQVGHRVLRKGDVVGCSLDLVAPEIKFSLNGQAIACVYKNFNVDGFFFPVMSLSAKVSCRFIFGRNQGKLKHGPPSGFSPVVEALNTALRVDECLSFGDLTKNILAGPSPTLHVVEPFVPTPIDTSATVLPQFAHDVHLRFAENLHELWAMRKIDLGWTYGEVRNEQNRKHPCLTEFAHLPDAEQLYNINLALDTMKAIESLGYHMVFDKPPTRIRPVRLPQTYVQSNGYKPQPLDTHEIELPETLDALIEALAKNIHNVWAKEKIKRGWTFGLNEYVDAMQKRTPHLVPYEQVDERIKEANRAAAAENIRVLQLFGIFLEPPVLERDEGAEKELKAIQALSRTYRAEATYKAVGGKWYYEFEVLTAGFMKVGWMDVSTMPDAKLGEDDHSYGFDGYLCRKWHQGAEQYGREWKVGDVVGVFLDLNDRTISFSLNGELLLDPSGSEMAFDNVIPCDGYVPAMTLAAGQRAKFNFGQESNSLKFFTTCGLQEGYEPFCVNMHRPMPMWYSKRLPTFTDFNVSSRMEVTRVPSTATTPPCLKLSQRVIANDAVITEKARMEYIRLSLPIKCNRNFVRKDKDALIKNLQELQKRSASLATIKAPGIPKEFEDTEIKKPKSKGKNFLSALRGRGDDDDRSHRGSNFDVSTMGDIPALAQRRRVFTLMNFGLYSFDESIIQWLSVDGEDYDSFWVEHARKTSMLQLSAEERSLAAERLRFLTSRHDLTVPHPQKKISGILGRIRDRQKNKDDRSSVGEGKRHRVIDDGEVTLRTMKSYDSASVMDGTHMSGHSSREVLNEMPVSGPGRQGTLRRNNSKRRKGGGKGGRDASSASPSPLVSSATSTAVPAAVAEDHRQSLAMTDVDSVSGDVVAMQQLGDQIDEYYFGLRIFPGQDPSNVWVGWVTSQFHSYATTFDVSSAVRKCRFNELDHLGTTSESVEYRNCYMLNAMELLNAVPDATNTKVAGLLIGCLIDTSVGELSFMAAGHDTGMKFKLEPGALLYPAVFVTPTSTEIAQFELGRIKYTFPLSAAMFKSSAKSLLPYCPPRLTAEKIYPMNWARVPNETLRTTALKLSDSRGWSVLCNDPIRSLMVYIPEKESSLDILELIEKTDLLKFHSRTLNLYCKLAAHGNQQVAHTLCAHVDESQLMYAVKSQYLSGAMRSGLHDFLVAVHLKTHADARLSTSKEYVIPLNGSLNEKNVFDERTENRYPRVVGPVASILPEMKSELLQADVLNDPDVDMASLLPPEIDFQKLKHQVMVSFRLATTNAALSCRDWIGGDNHNHFEPILKLVDNLLVIGLLTDDDIVELLKLIHPTAFDENYTSDCMLKGLTEIWLSEDVKMQLINILDRLCDIQLRHRIESLIAFCEDFVENLQEDQCKRYMDIKQTDMPPAEAARRTKEFRCPPKEQMFRLLTCKVKEEREAMLLDDDIEEDQCPMSDVLQDQLREFCRTLVNHLSCVRHSDEGVVDGGGVRGGSTSPKKAAQVETGGESWVDSLAHLVISVPPAPKVDDFTHLRRGSDNFRKIIISTLQRWANESEIESNELIRGIFNLLLRQYAGISELMDAMSKTYVLHERNVKDVECFITYLIQIRELLNVQLETCEEAILKRGLWQLMNNRIFFQHPDLMRLLRVHEDVMTIMMNVLTAQQSAVDIEFTEQGVTSINNASEMVVACSRFLCYFCRTSRTNQKAMFEHLSFMLDNATMLLARPSLRGSVPLDVAYSSFMDNNELALALKEEELDKVAVYLSRCGLQPNSELIAKDYPDILWDPVEGERYIDFLRFCVWINGENVEENANLVIRLLIRRPECLGLALKGDGQGLFAAFKEAIILSEDIRALEEGDDPQFLHSAILKEHARYPSKETENEDYVDLGAAILDFYSSLVDLLAKCAPDPLTIQAGKGDSVRARAILRSLISLDDLKNILSLRFSIPNLTHCATAEGNCECQTASLPLGDPPTLSVSEYCGSTNNTKENIDRRGADADNAEEPLIRITFNPFHDLLTSFALTNSTNRILKPKSNTNSNRFESKINNSKDNTVRQNSNTCDSGCNNNKESSRQDINNNEKTRETSTPSAPKKRSFAEVVTQIVSKSPKKRVLCEFCGTKCAMANTTICARCLAITRRFERRTRRTDGSEKEKGKKSNKKATKLTSESPIEIYSKTLKSTNISGSVSSPIIAECNRLAPAISGTTIDVEVKSVYASATASPCSIRPRPSCDKSAVPASSAQILENVCAKLGASISSRSPEIPQSTHPSPSSDKSDTGPLPGILPNHKQSILLFLDRVYGIDSQEMFFNFLEQSFLPDLRAATMMDSPRALESDTALALNRYLCNAVLPLLTNHSHYFADAEHHAALLDATLHTVYRMNRLRSLTKNQRDAVSDFLVALTRELPPGMMIKLLRKVIIDIQQASENVLVPLRIMTLHYERCNKYYGSGNTYGIASETEKRLSMLLFYAIFDSLGSKPYDPELFGRALPCLTAIGSAISPDYALTVGSERTELAKVQEGEGVWVPRPVDDSNIGLPNELNTMTRKFAEHFHDSWAARKLEKGWTHGELYSRQTLTHPRLLPFNLLQDYEREFYKERCAECLRALLAWNYAFEMVDPDANDRANQNRVVSGQSMADFNPRPIDLSNMNLEKRMCTVAEKMAENSHCIWARKVCNDLVHNDHTTMPLTLVPWDLLTDFERRKERFRAQEILKFFQYHGYRIFSLSESEPSSDRVKIESDRGSVEKRFAYNLLEKLIQYLEQEGQDVKFFEKVVLPLIHAYFTAHKNYFLASSSIVQTGMASNREKEMVAGLFCRLAALLRIKNHAFGSVARITVKCLQGLTQSLDFRILVKINSDIVRTGLLTFFNNCADDLFAAVGELKAVGQYSLLRGENLKSWISLEFANQMIIPILTTMFLHLGKNHYGTELLLEDIQAACYKILDSLYMVTSLTGSFEHRKTINYEVDKHRPALGQCLGAFASCFPIAFLESEYNANNKLSVLAKSSDQSVQVQEMLQNLSQHIPQLETILMNIEVTAQNGMLYASSPNVYDVDLPLLSAYLYYWWQLGPEGPNRTVLPVTQVDSTQINRMFCALLKLIRLHVGIENAPWLCRINYFAVPIIQYVTCDPVKDYMLPVAENIRRMAEEAFREEERMRTHPDDADESTVAEDNAKLVRDVYAFFPILMKFTDLHRAKWLKSPTWESDGVYENVAVIFKIWSLSQHFKREELNYMVQFEEDATMAVGGEMKTGKAAIAERKKKRREGHIQRDKHANSIVIACIKRLLPVGLNVFGGRELDIVQQCKEKFLAKEGEDKIREFIRGLLDVPVKTDPTDKNAWQLNLYRKIGKSQMRGKDEMSQDAIVEKIANMSQVVAILHAVTSRFEKEDRWKKVLTLQRKRMAISLITASHLYKVDKHRAINYFLPAFSEKWLADEDVGRDALVVDICGENLDTESHPIVRNVVEDESMLRIEDGSAEDRIALTSNENGSGGTSDALKQLIQCFQRAATSEESQAMSIADDQLYIRYADVMSKSIHIDEGDDDAGDDGEMDQAEKEEIAQHLRAEQAVLADRGAAIMCLMYLSSSNGEPNEMVAQTLQLGIHLLSGGNKGIQRMLIDYLQLKKDVRFFTSMAGLMNKCSVLNLEMFERQIKAEGLGMGAELAAGEHQNLNDADFTCSLFRFLQLTCEGHNLDFQNYLRTQPGHTTSINLINATVDYLLRLQESIMDFYWHYSSKEVIDEGGKEYFLRAIQVCSQVFNTLTECIQGPCVGNQMTLANSRLWDAINGFFFLFAHMMEKLYKNSTQLELLREFLNLQKDMIVLMLSMLEGNVLNGPIGKQMVDALVESQQCVEMILKFSDMFLKLKDLTTSQAFQDFDTNQDGWISPKEFQRAMEAQKMYSTEEITYLMMCTDVNNDGKVDYMEFTERFHNPARDIGFNLAVLLTNLKEHITSDPRLEKIVEKASSLLEYFDPFLGRIEIMGSSKRVEKIYFEIQESWLEQWSKQQIRDSKNAFLFNVLQDDGGDQGKLEAFINFCEDTIFEMQHAAEISSSDSSDSKVERAMRQRDIYFLHLENTTAGEQLSNTLRFGYKYSVTAAEALKPNNLTKTVRYAAAKFRTMTWAQLFLALAHLAFLFGKEIFFILHFLVLTLFRFLFYLTSSPDDEAEQVQQTPTTTKQKFQPMPHYYNRDYSRRTPAHDVDAFGINLHHTDDFAHERTPMSDAPLGDATSTSQPNLFQPPQSNGHAAGMANGGLGASTECLSNGNANKFDAKTSDDGFLKPPHSATPPPGAAASATPRPSIYDTQSFISVQQQQYQQLAVSDTEAQVESGYEPKIADQLTIRSRGSILNILARNFKSIEKITLYLAFFINVILLFHRVDIATKDKSAGQDGDDDGEDDVDESIYITGMTIPYFYYEITGWLLAQILYWLSVLHAFASFALLVSFYQLKIPLITFKREKEVARRLMFDGCWITEDENEDRGVIDTLFWFLDRIVISSKSFPMKYWDKFVRRKTKQKYREQVDEETLNTLLGTERSPGDTSFDYRYMCWLWAGVILTNRQFLYRVSYLICSVSGVLFSPFFYAFLLIDVVLSFPMLKAILQSVTHNLQQLILTIMMTLVVVYLYTVVAFNFFRKFYVQDEEEGGEPDRKCHYMLTCFIYHFYAGVRAGGGIGDELESPYGDDLEYARMLYDISFFFFVIVILLAIMQGLIIDAFGELRDQQDAATDKLESSCFICDIGKDYFDRLPRGFEVHTTKEHNFANYLFFLQHLVNKDETEYTGQETYVREKYDNRDWEFFPVGECFMKQYEDQLLQS